MEDADPGRSSSITQELEEQASVHVVPSWRRFGPINSTRSIPSYVDKTAAHSNLASWTTYEELKNMDKRRKKLLTMQACHGPTRLMFHVSGTVLVPVLRSVELWSCVFLYVLSRIALNYKWFTASEIGDFRGLPTVGILLVFMLNFYVNTCICRFFNAIDESMAMIGRINNIALRLRALLWDTDEKQKSTRRIVDYLCAAQALGYIGLTSEYTHDNFWRGFNAEFGVLTKAEDAAMLVHASKGGSRYREAMCWVFEELNDMSCHIPAPVLCGMYQVISEFQLAMQKIYDYRYQPIPFVSEHILVVFLHVYLPVQTTEMAFQAQILKDQATDDIARLVVEMFGMFLAVLACIGFVGLFWVGAFIEDPFGPDISDARVVHFCRMATMESRRVLAAGNPKKQQRPLQLEMERRLELKSCLGQSGVALSEHFGIRALEELVEMQAKHPQFQDCQEEKPWHADGMNGLTPVLPSKAQVASDEESTRSKL
eukprot:TRINITY_DN93976_c0_g1_i1.p1 TRINITY_DN93976_c0_g1~~TRINITY_DN93976_c0_g1_i1.p1  ORF type:complete len:502 (-),score=81.58 TRINITY_DN93976_c0_g1_i1:8-1459(-)